MTLQRGTPHPLPAPALPLCEVVLQHLGGHYLSQGHEVTGAAGAPGLTPPPAWPGWGLPSLPALPAPLPPRCSW